jgi:hypothetical protein
MQHFGERHARERRRQRRHNDSVNAYRDQDRRGCRPHEGVFGAVIIEQLPGE